MPAIAPPATSGSSAAVAAALTRGSIVQPVAIRTPASLTNPMASLAVPPFGPAVGTPGSQIVVDVSQTHQDWLGCGGAITDASALELFNMPAAARLALLTEAFGTNGYATVRIGIGCTDFTSRAYYTYADNGGVADPNLTSFSIAPDENYIIPILQQIVAINPDVHIIASCWTPPVWMKVAYDNANPVSLTNGIFVANATNFSTLAQYFVKFIQAYAAHGITIYAVTPQNEPNYGEPGSAGAYYPGCNWAAGDLATFIGTYFGPALDNAGLFTKIWSGDTFWSYPTYAGTVLSTAASMPFVDGTAWHGYGGGPLAMLQTNRPYVGKTAHLTEWTGFFADTANGAMDKYAGVALISNARYGGGSATSWNFILNEKGGPWQAGPNASTCRGMITLNSQTGVLTRNLEYYAFAHMGFYIQKGAKRCRSNTFCVGANQNDVMNVAFLNPDGSRVVVLYNASGVSRTVTIADGVTVEDFPITLASKDMVTVMWGPGTTVAAGTYTAPTQPLNLTGSVSNGAVSLAWGAPATVGSSDLGGYIINHGTIQGGAKTILAIVPGTQLNFLDTLEAVGSTDYFTIQAFGIGGSSLPSNEISVTVVATVPGAPNASATAGNGNITLNVSATSSGGSPVTGFNVYQGAAAGAEATTPVLTNQQSPIVVTAANGTAQFFTVTAVNTVGESAHSTEVTATPSSAISAPAHYLSATSGTGGSAGITTPASTTVATDGVLDIQVWINLSSYTPSKTSLILGNYPASGGTIANEQFGLSIGTDGQLSLYTANSTKAFVGFGSGSGVTLGSVNPSATLGIWARCFINAGSSAVNDVNGVSHPANSLQFYTAAPAATPSFSTFGAQQSIASLNVPTTIAGYYIFGAASGVSLVGKFYKAIVYGSSGRILMNPDFTAQATGTTSFVDTATAANTWAVNTPDTIT